MGFNLNMHKGSLVVDTMEMKRGSHAPPSATLYFDLTDIYGVQSEGTVKNGNVGSHSTWWAPLQNV